MRRNLGSPSRDTGSGTYPEVGEAGYSDVLPRLRRQLLAQLLDRLGPVLFRVDVLLVEQRHVLRPLGELALDDLLDHLVRLAFLAGLLLEDAALCLALLLGDLVGGDVRRRGRRNVQGDLV